MNFLEKNLEDIIFDNKENLSQRGLLNVFYANTKRQVVLPNGRKIDILTWEIVDDVINARIIELKKDFIDESALFQGVFYYLDLLGVIGGHFSDYNIEIILVGSNISDNVINISHLSNFIRAITYSYKYDGIKFFEINRTCDKVKSQFPKFDKDCNTDNFVNMLRDN